MYIYFAAGGLQAPVLSTGAPSPPSYNLYVLQRRAPLHIHLSLQCFQDKILKQQSQSTLLWFLINRLKFTNNSSLQSVNNHLQDSIATAFVLEELIKLTVTSFSNNNNTSTYLPSSIQDFTNFYSRMELNKKQIKYTLKSLSRQILRINITNSSHSSATNPFYLLFHDDDPIDTMDIDDNNQTSKRSQQKNVSWSTDFGIAALSEDIFSHMADKKQKAADAGDLNSDAPDYVKPQTHFVSSEKLNQRIRFNFIRHKESFHSFATTLKKADPSIIIHPFQASKQHYSSLATL